MNFLLGENIRSLRKKQGLTQEQLAEMLGVTPGAVYKWEAKLSVPDISLIIELADFFDVSIDVLLGYDIKGKSRTEALARIKNYVLAHDRECLSESEKALKKYPNNFDVVIVAADCYRLFGISENGSALLRRGIELYNRALALFSQNTNPEISETLICRKIADSYIALEETEHGIEILKQNNPIDVNSDLIGRALALNHRYDEAISYLSKALLSLAMNAVQTVTGYINVYFEREEYSEAEAIIHWCIELLRGLHAEGKISAMDKVLPMLFVCLGETKLKTGSEAGARAALLQAAELARAFDAAPCYDVDSIRFIKMEKPAAAYDDVGETAAAGIENALGAIDDGGLSAIWEEMQK